MFPIITLPPHSGHLYLLTRGFLIKSTVRKFILGKGKRKLNCKEVGTNNGIIRRASDIVIFKEHFICSNHLIFVFVLKGTLSRWVKVKNIDIFKCSKIPLVGTLNLCLEKIAEEKNGNISVFYQ